MKPAHVRHGPVPGLVPTRARRVHRFTTLSAYQGGPNHRTKEYVHRTLHGGIGHNLPQEAPLDFVDAIEEADRLTG
jgi:hypothetical protein